MQILIDLVIPVVFGSLFTLIFSQRSSYRFLAIVLCFITAVVYSYLKYFPKLNISVQPNISSIYLDGQLKGSGTKEMRVSFGRHYLRLCHKDIHLYHECLEQVEPNYFNIRKINRTLIQKRGNLSIQLKYASSRDTISVKKVSIYTSNYNDSKINPPYYFSQVPSGKYKIFLDYNKNGIETTETREAIILDATGSSVVLTM